MQIKLKLQIGTIKIETNLLFLRESNKVRM